jgi:8-oxo-dGTP pyrophosphatase MutT (NUDIX family)
MRTQYAALPYRRVAGSLLVLLITSRDTKRWIIPRGWPIPTLTPHETAAREALQEAGVVGRVREAAIGNYAYMKRLQDGSVVKCRVKVFALEVQQQRRSWPESRQRQRKWVETGGAAKQVMELGLRSIIRSLSTRLASTPLA